MTINLFCHHNGFSLSRRKITWLRWHELHCWTHVSWRAFVNMKICTGAAIAALFGFMAAAELCVDDVSCQHDLATRFAPEFRLDKSSVEKKRCLPGHPATCQYLEKVTSMDETILLCQLPRAASQNCYILFAHCCTFVNASPWSRRQSMRSARRATRTIFARLTSRNWRLCPFSITTRQELAGCRIRTSPIRLSLAVPQTATVTTCHYMSPLCPSQPFEYTHATPLNKNIKNKLGWYPQPHGGKIQPQRICAHHFAFKIKRSARTRYINWYFPLKITFPKSNAPALHTVQQTFARTSWAKDISTFVKTYFPKAKRRFACKKHDRQ